MYHEGWNLSKTSTIDLFAFASKMADIDQNIDPYSFRMISFGLLGERIRLSTHRSAHVNIELIDSLANNSQRVDDLYLGEGNFTVNVRENKGTANYTRVHAGTGYSSIEGAQEMYGNDSSDSIFIASTHTKIVRGGSMRGDALGFGKDDNLDVVYIDAAKVTYFYFVNGTQTLRNVIDFSNIKNFVIADHASQVVVNQGAETSPISLLMAERADRLVIEQGHVITTTAPTAGMMDILVQADSSEIALNSTGNRVNIGVEYQYEPPNRGDNHYAVSTVVGNQFAALHASANIAYELRPIGNEALKTMSEPTLSILGSHLARSSFSFDLAELWRSEKPVQLHLVGSQTYSGRYVPDNWVDRINLTSPVESNELLFSPGDIHLSKGRASQTSFIVADHHITDRIDMLQIKIRDKTVVEVRSLLSEWRNIFSQTDFDIYLDNNLLSHQIIG